MGKFKPGRGKSTYGREGGGRGGGRTAENERLLWTLKGFPFNDFL